MMNIITLIGSIRKDSYNLQLARTMQERYKEKLQIEIADIKSLPHFDQDDEENPPQVVRDLKDAIAGADGVLILTPEYNWSIPGVLKNAIDWTSRVEKPFINKPVMTVGVTPGMLGTVRAQMHLREILSAPGLQAKILPPGGNEVLINFAVQKFDPEQGRLVDKMTLDFLDGIVDKFVEFIKSK